MRPPKLKWEKIADAFSAIAVLFETIERSSTVPPDVVGLVRNVNLKINLLVDHIYSAEECERD